MMTPHLFVFLRNNLLTRSLRRVKELNIQCHWTERFCSFNHNNNNNKNSVMIERTITYDDVNTFSVLTKDFNSIHSPNKNKEPIVHGALLNGIVSGVIGTKLPGDGTVVISQTLKYPKPCYVGDTVCITVELLEVRKIITCSYNVINKRNGAIVLEGSAKLLKKKYMC